ncbi:unnamed protein product [Musa acuminata subsp. burmannicoides]
MLPRTQGCRGGRRERRAASRGNAKQGDYSSFIVPATGGMVTSVNKHFLGNENGFLNDMDSPQNEPAKKEHLPASTSQKLVFGRTNYSIPGKNNIFCDAK